MTTRQSQLLALFCALAVLAATGLGAQQAGGRAGGPPGVAPTPQPPVVLKPGAGVILGKVTETGTTTGVPNAVVILTGAALGPPAAVFANGLPAGPRLIIADGQGQFLFRELPPGAYAITATAVGYVTGVYGQVKTSQLPGPIDLDVTRFVELTEADRVMTASIQMSKFGGIGGSVVDEAGEPMVGVPVTVLARTSEWSRPVLRNMASVTTDDRGMYHTDVSPGDYLVGVLAATTTVPVSAVDGFQQAVRTGGATMREYMNGILASGSLLPRGVGVRAGSFMVSQFGAQNSWTVPPLQSVDGRLMFYPTTFHPSGLDGASASIVTVASGEEKSGVDLHMRAVLARRVSGRVVDASGPVAGMALRLHSPDFNADDGGTRLVTGDIPQAMTDGAGNFTFLGVAPGRYTARLLRLTTAAEPVAWAAEPITVGADADVTDLTIRLQNGATIGGRVVVDGVGPPPSPAALRGISIKPLAVPGTPGALMGFMAWVVRPDAKSEFTTGQLIPGPYLLGVTGLPPGWFVKSATAGGQNALDKPLALTAGGITDVVVTITDRATSLTGIARDDKGQPATLATVVVFPADKSLWPPPGLGSRRIQVSAPGRDGRFAFSTLPTGDYFVVAAEGTALDFSDSRVWTALIAAASRVTINEGATVAQDLRVTVVR